MRLFQYTVRTVYAEDLVASVFRQTPIKLMYISFVEHTVEYSFLLLLLLLQ